MDEMIQILKGFYCMNFAEMPLKIHGQQIWNSAAYALYQSLFYVIYVYVIGWMCRILRVEINFWEIATVISK